MTLPRIPWAYDTEVVRETPRGIILLSGPHQANVFADANAEIYHDPWRKLLWFADFREDLTEDLRGWIRSFEPMCRTEKQKTNLYLTWLEGDPNWINPFLPGGVKEWFPFQQRRHPRYKLIEEGYYSAGHPLFRYITFLDDHGRQGIIVFRISIYSNKPPEAEVWTGDIRDFVNELRDPEEINADTMYRWNLIFENGLLWALERLGWFFRAIPGGPLPAPGMSWYSFEKNDRVDRLWPIRLLKQHPEFLWPEFVRKWAPRAEYLDPILRRTLREWSAAQWEEEAAAGMQPLWPSIHPRRGRDKASGQSHLWPGIHPEEEGK